MGYSVPYVGNKSVKITINFSNVSGRHTLQVFAHYKSMNNLDGQWAVSNL